MYTGLLHAHSGFRWLLLAIILIALIKYFIGLTANKKWGKADNVINISLVSLMDIQLLTGLILYFFASPITKMAMQNFGMAMKNADLRFYAVEHFFVMLLAAVLLHIGRSKTKKAATDKQKFSRSLVWIGIVVVLVVAGIPWSRV